MGAPIVLFGAFDRHNLGDLLFPHIAAALLPGEELVFAGLAARDLRGVGGHQVQAIAALAAAGDGRPARLVHVGGETLGCGAWPAAVMLLSADEVQATVAYLEPRPAARAAWLRRMLGRETRAPYVVSRRDWPGLVRVVHAGVGGVELDRAEPAMRSEVMARLREADAIHVRDARTRSLLVHEGIPAALMPDPAVLVAELFGDRIRAAAARGEPAAIAAAFAQGWLAVQFSTAFGDDATLATIAAQLARAQAASGLGVVLFRAGAAPWHDDLGTLERVARVLPAGTARVFGSLDIWDICALIAASRGFVGSSLHGRIVALAFARPRISLASPKVDAFAATWDGTHPGVAPERLAAAIEAALGADPAGHARLAADLAAHCRRGFDALRRALQVQA